MKITPVRGHCYFAKPDCCRSAPAANHKPNVSFCSFGKMRKMENFDSHKVAFEEALRCLSEFNVSHALKSEQKEEISTLVLERIY